MSDMQIGDAFRQAMRRMAASVSIVTAASGEERAGATVSSVVSVSFDPLSLLVCIHKSSRFYDMINGQDSFCINLLDRRQADISDKFSRPASESDLFGTGDWQLHNGLPWLKGAQANFFLEKKETCHFGTHAIIIGEVRDIFYADEISPLIYLNGAYTGAC
ncbi:flavin reductase family protein [Emcibacter sp.]|uniref:flavin reductase family protein n=1 Tax=Emcibacter sp. TaxID=1979954 RepID=UPI002AA60C97|nr:flavin reductase family protein [Emcibacter sp.]